MARAFLVYLAAAIVFTWPLALHPTSRLAAPPGPGDGLLNLWILGWGLHTFVTAPLDVLRGRVFNANIFYPAESTLAYSDHFLFQAALLSPLFAITGDVVLCYNVLFFASLLLSGVAMHAFVRAVTASTGGAYLAGLTWAFWSYRIAHLPHPQLQALYFLPLTFLFLHRVMAGRRHRDALWLGVALGLQAVSSVYYAVIGAIGIAAGAPTLAMGIGRWRSGIIARRLLLAAAVGIAIVAPVAWVYLRVQQNEGFQRGLYQAGRNAAAPASYAQVAEGNLLYGRTGLLSEAGLERALFPGLTVLVLAVFGVVRARGGDARPLAASMVVVGLLGLLLSFGPDGFRDLYALLQRYFVGFEAIRAPARFAVLVTFALCTLAALGWRELPNRPLQFALLCLAALECAAAPLRLADAPARQTLIGQWLAREPGAGAVIHLPIALDVESTPLMVQSLEHRRPLVNGYSGQRPDFYAPLVESLSTFPADEALLALNEMGVRFVVTAAPVAAPSAEGWPLVERARFVEGVIYEMRWTPEIESRLAAALDVRPPPPGAMPFAAGEMLRYRAFWEGAGMNASAGELTLEVRDPPITLVARGDTAPWMNRFFEAHAVFTTHTDNQLLPLVHERDQVQGSRRLTRTFVYDRNDRIVRIRRDNAAADEEGVSLPLAPSARDAVAALYYVRTLSLQPGARHLIPVNDAGRNLVVEVVVAARETLTLDGQSVAAVRVEPRIRRRADRRRPIEATVWFSDDGRKQPLALDLHAAFGRVRLELVRNPR